MKRLTIVLLAIVIGFVVLPPSMQGQQEPRYDTRTVGTFSGVVSKIGSHEGKRGHARTRLSLKTKDGTVELHLGPTVFLDEKGFRFAEGDSLTAIGSRVPEEGGGELIIVRHITKGKQALALRDEEGRPLWEDRHK